MPRMPKYLKREWAFFLDERGRKKYNELCRKCERSCKQSFRAAVILCPHYQSKRSEKQYVPDEQRAAIEARIERENAAEQARLEAKRLFAVFHIRENGEDYHFTSDHFRTPMQAAYRYRLYDRGELSANPETLAAAFIETNPISLKQFNEACTDINSDKRITALIEFDLDEGNVSICDSSDNAWWTYTLHDFSVAAYKAFRSDYRDEECRREIFNNSLAGKEIDLSEETADENESTSPTMQM